MRLLHIAVLAAVLVFVSGCSSISMKIPANRFDSPEVRGQPLKGFVDGVTLQGSTEAILVKDFTAVPPTTNVQELGRSDLDYMIGGGLGVHERFDIIAKLPNDSPFQLGAKFQALGEPELSAKKGNFSLGITLTGAIGSDSGNGKQVFGNNPETHYELNMSGFDTSVVTGYRIHDQLMFYGGPAFTYLYGSGEVTQPAGTANVYTFSGTSRQFAINIGVQADFGAFSFKLSEAWANAQFAGKHRDDFYTGFQVSGKF